MPRHLTSKNRLQKSFFFYKFSQNYHFFESFSKHFYVRQEKVDKVKLNLEEIRRKEEKAGKTKD